MATRKTKSTTKSSKKKTTKKKSSTLRASTSGGTKKKSTKKKTTKKTASKAATAKKSTTKKTAAKKSTAKKSAVKKKTTKKKTAVKKKTTKKVASKTAPKKKTASGKTAKKSSAKKAPPKKVTSKKKTTSKKAPAKKAAASSATSSKKKTKKKTSRKAAGRSVAEVARTTDADDSGYVFINGRRVRTMIRTERPTRRVASDRSAEPAPAAETAPAKPIKTKLDRKQLKQFQDLLLQRRAELITDLGAMEREALRVGDDNTPQMPIHMADVGTDAYDQDFMLRLTETERERVREIDEALQRIADKTYGICMMTGKPIPKARLNAKPWAKYTIEAARIIEGGGLGPLR